MGIKKFNACLVVLIASASFASLQGAQSGADADRIARLEARLAELEARLSDNEQETKEVKVLAANSGAGTANNASILGNAASFDILANSAWRNLRWTQEEQWAGIRKGITEEQVIELLGSPPRTVKSMKPRVDLVFYYETSIRDRSNALKGKISFKNGKVIAIQKPNFQTSKSGN
jgi:outer membrane protein assembly factor BamE (lipoprotein component of BamABCDE complex)